MNLNKVFLIGRLTQDPELRSTPSGQSVATIRLATNRVWNNQATGQKQEATEFHTIVAWGRLAEIANQYLKKGAMALFEGRLQTRSWDDKNTGAKRYMTEIVAENMQLGPRPGGVGASGQAVADVKRPPSTSSGQAATEPEIPIIDENELTRQGVDEHETSIKDVDLPF